jgi:sulfhydrogenase subunit alpha
MTREINLNHICKVEGHAHLNLKIRKNKVQKCQLKATEGARFFEALVKGKKVEDVQEIVSRICGICSSAHTVCSIQALEEALGIKPTKQQQIIRELLMIGERVRSHSTHLYFMALPDYLGFSSALTMTKQHQDKINNALSLISIGNKIIEAVGGREIHPFLNIKEKIQKREKQKEQKAIEKLENEKQKIIKTIELFSSLKYPKLERDTEYLSLHNKNNYAIISGKIKSRSKAIRDDEYKKHLKENIKEYATSKFALKDGHPFVTGAIARINNNYHQLDKESWNYLKKLHTPFNNPFQNNIAQSIELLHMANRAKYLIRQLQDEETKQTKIRLKKGHAVSSCEAPRVTLFHEYKINNKGRISYCNIITPTVQNLNMMEKDIISYVNNLLYRKNKPTKKQIILEIEKLIRAYDPCFSCSTHFLKVNWE